MCDVCMHGYVYVCVHPDTHPTYVSIEKIINGTDDFIYIYNKFKMHIKYKTSPTNEKYVVKTWEISTGPNI